MKRGLFFFKKLLLALYQINDTELIFKTRHSKLKTKNKDHGRD